MLPFSIRLGRNRTSVPRLLVLLVLPALVGPTVFRVDFPGETVRAADPPVLAPVPAAYRAGFATITERKIRAWIAFLASEELGGRGTGQPGYDVAARYVASVLEGLGVKPGAADGTYFQSFELYGRQGVDTARLVIQKENAAPQEIALGDKVGIRGLHDVDWALPWVFVGRGEAADADARDDFHGVALEGGSREGGFFKDRVVLVLPPKGKTSREHVGAELRGAKRIVVVSDRHANRRRGFRGRPQPEYRLLEREGVGRDVSVVYITEEATDRLLQFCDSGPSRASDSGPPTVRTLRSARRAWPLLFEGLKIRLEVKARERRMTSRNVVGVLEGSDPELKREFVGVGAHLDHMGRNGDKIFYGADDDASGVSTVLAAAEALTANPERPRRSVVFLFFGSEEMGLHGSRYFADNPPFALSRMVAQLQVDMVGRNEETKDEKAADNAKSVHVVGSKKHSLELDGWVHKVNAPTGLDFEYDMENVVYRRSDHYNFARRGVPVVFFFSGFHPDYHKVTDTPEKLNYTKILQVSRLVYSLTFEIAHRPQRLVNNRF